MCASIYAFAERAEVEKWILCALDTEMGKRVAVCAGETLSV